LTFTCPHPSVDVHLTVGFLIVCLLNGIFQAFDMLLKSDDFLVIFPSLAAVSFFTVLDLDGGLALLLGEVCLELLNNLPEVALIES
jgi:hypothetical protein